ncbi:MAG: hypothetical protein ACOVQA_11360 [Thermoflexibacteraceae bacterium]|jgi:hypothetical protein
MKRYIALFCIAICLLSTLQSCGGAVRTAWTPPTYGKGQKKKKLEWLKMGMTPLNRRNPTH